MLLWRREVGLLSLVVVGNAGWDGPDHDSVVKVLYRSCGYLERSAVYGVGRRIDRVRWTVQTSGTAGRQVGKRCGAVRQ